MCDNNKSFKFGLRKSSFDDTTEQKLCFSYNPNIVLPKKYSLRDKVKFIFDQKNVNSCSANAVSQQLILSDKKTSNEICPFKIVYLL